MKPLNITPKPAWLKRINQFFVVVCALRLVFPYRWLAGIFCSGFFIAPFVPIAAKFLNGAVPAPPFCANSSVFSLWGTEDSSVWAGASFLEGRSPSEDLDFVLHFFFPQSGRGEDLFPLP